LRHGGGEHGVNSGTDDDGDAEAEFAARDELAKWEKVKESTVPLQKQAETDARQLEAWRRGLRLDAPIEAEAGGRPAASSQDSPVPKQAVEWIEKNQWDFSIFPVGSWSW
jgi:hypothetical protein